MQPRWSRPCPPRRDMVTLEMSCRRSTAGRSITAFRVRRKISYRRPCRQRLWRTEEDFGFSTMPVISEEKRNRRIVPPPPVLPGGDGDDGGAGDFGGSFPISKGQLGLWILLTAIIMLFAGLSSAYIVLRGVPAWQNIELPSLLWPNTAILFLSSVAFELSRRAIRRGDLQSMKRWLAVA